MEPYEDEDQDPVDQQESEGKDYNHLGGLDQRDQLKKRTSKTGAAGRQHTQTTQAFGSWLNSLDASFSGQLFRRDIKKMFPCKCNFDYPKYNFHFYQTHSSDRSCCCVDTQDCPAQRQLSLLERLVTLNIF